MLFNDTFRTLIDDLSMAQKDAALSISPRIIVQAGAGTGKTKTLVARICHLVHERHIAPSRIVVTTYTNKAAIELKERCSHYLGKDVSSRIVAGTFHSLGARMMRKNPDLFGLSKKFIVIDEEDGEKIIQYIAENKNISLSPRDAYTQISRWKNWGLTHDQMVGGNRPFFEDSTMNTMLDIAVEYDKILHEKGMVDFGDLILKPVVVMRDNPEFLSIKQGEIDHLLIDEAQDANPTQVRFARYLSNNQTHVFVVGDEDQSIFSFQGGYPEAILHLAGKAPAIYYLRENRRSTDEILKPSVQLVAYNRRKYPKFLTSNVHGSVPECMGFANDSDEAEHIIKSIKAIKESKGGSYKDFAILARSTFVYPAFEEALVRAKIPYEIVGGVALLERKEIRDIVAYLRLALNANDDLAFSRIVNCPPRGIGPSLEESVLQHWRLGHEEGNDGLALACLKAGNNRDVKGLFDLSVILDRLNNGVYLHDLPPFEILKIILSESGVGYLKHMGLPELDEKAVFSRDVDGRKLQRKFLMIQSVVSLSLEVETLEELIEFISLGALSSNNEVDETLTLSTMHSSKGLEWDHVFICSFDDQVIPSPRSLKTSRPYKAGDCWNGPMGGGMEEERRLAHVAMTRAKKTLTVTYSLRRNGKNINPSVFIAESGLHDSSAKDQFWGRLEHQSKKGRFANESGRKGFAKKGGK